MKNWRLLLLDWRVLLALAGTLFVVHLVWTYLSRNGADLARCGALWAIISGVLIGRSVLRMGYADWFGASRVIGGEPFVPTEADLERYRQDELDAWCSQVVGPVLLVAGTLLWGYGDLLGAWLLKYA